MPRPEWREVPPEVAIDRLATAGLLTERQAEAYVWRRIEMQPGYAVADHMGINESTLSDYVAAAEEKVEAAEETVEQLEQLRHRPISDECSNCGTALGGRFATDDDDNPVCLDCSGADG
jgi:hypothetical protein